MEIRRGRRKRRISHKGEEEDQIKATIKENQAKKDLKAMIKSLFYALFARRTTMTMVIISLKNVPVVRI